jgi:heme exporter protein CcmD
MSQGMIVGGWQYVWMAYGLTFAVFAIYAVSLLTRLREASKEMP